MNVMNGIKGINITCSDRYHNGVQYHKLAKIVEYRHNVKLYMLHSSLSSCLNQKVYSYAKCIPHAFCIFTI